MSRIILADVLKKKRISKREFGRRLGIDPKNVFRLFKATADPRFSELRRYAKAIGCKVRELIKD